MRKLFYSFSQCMTKVDFEFQPKHEKTSVERFFRLDLDKYFDQTNVKIYMKLKKWADVVKEVQIV